MVSRGWSVLGFKRNEAIASFSDDSFGKQHAKSFVLSAFSYWEDTIRPKIVKILGVHIKEAESDIMGEWRLLRNWLTHPTDGGGAEEQYFSRAKTLPRVLNSQPRKTGGHRWGCVLTDGATEFAEDNRQPT